ncbi:hypothetical protein [uncultured Tateyamaria sp.]|uniref:hypothetical protein n=1 Tax=uncultured Tateyamaria sp. TaxID=455651 RepID=UPI002605A8D7|nr:hypothetical protein [uncultured Tateyamaria sp.]
MSREADAIYLVASYSIQGFYIEKAVKYTELAAHLFPKDSRLIELHSYALLLKGDFDEAEDVLNASAIDTTNTKYLRARLGMLRQLSAEERGERIRRALGTYNN